MIVIPVALACLCSFALGVHITTQKAYKLIEEQRQMQLTMVALAMAELENQNKEAKTGE